MEDMNAFDTTAALLFGAAAGVSELPEAMAILAASDPSVTHYYQAAAAARHSVDMPHADATYRIGHTHETEGRPCQDYALALCGRTEIYPFAVASDGCSLSGETDIGARIFARAARTVLARWMPISGPGEADLALGIFQKLVLEGGGVSVQQMDLVAGDMDATLACVQALPGGGARNFLLGDGVIAARTPSGIEAIIVEWAGNMPGYPSYSLPGQEDRLSLFLAQSEEVARVERRAPWSAERFLLNANGEAASQGIEERSASDGLIGLAVDWPPGTDVAAVMSDGVLQISGMAWPAAVLELLAIRTARHGAFASRRVTRFLTAISKLGNRPEDDLCVASLAAKSES